MSSESFQVWAGDMGRNEALGLGLGSWAMGLEGGTGGRAGGASALVTSPGPARQIVLNAISWRENFEERL